MLFSITFYEITVKKSSCHSLFSGAKKYVVCMINIW